MKYPTEQQEQKAVIDYYTKTHPLVAELLTASLNGVPLFGKTRFAVMAQAKKAGLSKGFPDLQLPVPNGEYHGLFIEMKRQKGGVVSPEQLWWIKTLNFLGYQAKVCAGAEEAIRVINDYMSGVCLKQVDALKHGVGA